MSCAGAGLGLRGSTAGHGQLWLCRRRARAPWEHRRPRAAVVVPAPDPGSVGAPQAAGSSGCAGTEPGLRGSTAGRGQLWLCRRRTRAPWERRRPRAAVVGNRSSEERRGSWAPAGRCEKAEKFGTWTEDGRRVGELLDRFRIGFCDRFLVLWKGEVLWWGAMWLRPINTFHLYGVEGGKGELVESN
ncbi:hypothetical protein E4U38_002742 [Claviceps purpurea]|nr:hypothetical protein E4U38_002742 [Claviceps purpurea]